MVVLDESVRLVTIQFRFTNPDVIPLVVMRCLDRETKEAYVERKSYSSGVTVVEPTTNCSLAEFSRQLEAEGYEMVDMLFQERPYNEKKNTKGWWTYYMVRFMFARHEFAEPSDEFKKMRDVSCAELRSICENVMWCLKIDLNPFYKNGEEIAGQYAVSINLTARQPLLRPDGQSVTMWQKDENGNCVGDAPIPLKPDHHLRVIGFGIHLEKT